MIAWRSREIQLDIQTNPVEHVIKPPQLCVGLHVHLDLPWIAHPFPFQSFKIKSEEELASLRGLALPRVRYSPLRSDCPPAAATPENDDEAFAMGAASPEDGETGRRCANKQALVTRLAAQREKIAACKREFINTTRQMKAVRDNLFSRPEDVFRLAADGIAKLADSPLVDVEVTIELVSDDAVGDKMFSHALNVALLSMMVGKELQLPVAELRLLGIGALLHDLGQAEIPPEIKNKTERWTRSELALMHRHCALGVSLGKSLGLPPEVLLIIAQHHERVDGSGYPQKLSGEQISPLARIVAVMEAYDDLCHPNNAARALTPHEALAKIYAQRQKHFDESALTSFVRCLTVYPAGTIVLLSNGALGEVVAVNSARLRRPTVMVYDTAATNSDAILVDLDAQPDVEIERALRLQQLPTELGQFIVAKKRSAWGAHADAPA